MFIEFLLQFFPFFRYTHWDAARNGKSDGKIGIPTPDQQKQPPYVMKLKNKSAEEITRLAQDWKAADEKFLSQYCMTSREITTVEAYLEKAKSDLGIADKDEEESFKEYVKHFHFAGGWYWVFVIGIALLEVPLNSIVFQLFGENQSFTILTSLSLAFVLPFCAHFLGGFLKQGFKRDGKITIHTVLIVLMISLPLLLLGGISYFREKFFEGSGVSKILNIEMDPVSIVVTFFSLNLLIFLIATVASFVAHDPVATRYSNDLKDARKLKKNSTKNIKIYERRLEELRERRAEISSIRLARFRKIQNKAEQLREIAQVLMSEYQTHNLRVRTGGGEMPLCFSNFPPIDVPPTIEPGTDSIARSDLNWDCNDFPHPEVINEL